MSSTSNIATSSNTTGTPIQRQDDPQQVVIMTSMAEGLVADAKDLEEQQPAVEPPAEATATTMPIEVAVSKNGNGNVDNNYAEHNNYADHTDTIHHPANNKNFSNRIKRRFSSKDHSNNNHSPNNNTPITIPPATKAPKETLKAVYAAGKYKAGLTVNVLAVQSFMAGVYIAFAGHLYLAVGGGVLGAALFPGGLIAVILTSAELFTGDALIFVASVLGKQVKLQSLLRNWTVAWISNFVGCVVWAFFLGYLSDAIVDSGAKELAIKVAEKKALNDLSSIFIKAIGANFMVCVAVWQGTCAEEVAGKVLALWFPTAAFVMMGFDHVVANMFLIPMGMMLGANVSVGQLFAALFMATLGNVIGGGVFVGAVYWYVFDSMASFGGLTSRIRQNMRHMNLGRNLHHAGSSSWGHHQHKSPALSSVEPPSQHHSFSDNKYDEPEQNA